MAESYEVIVSPLAEQDLEQILDYLLEQAGLQTATNIQETFLTALSSLEKMPSAHGLLRELNQLPVNKYRRVLVKNAWRVIFEIDEEKRCVYVLRILHVKRGPEFVIKALE